MSAARSKGFNGRFNFEGLTHKCYPFMFRLTLCGLPVHRTTGRVTYDKRRNQYTACKRCYK